MIIDTSYIVIHETPIQTPRQCAEGILKNIFPDWDDFPEDIKEALIQGQLNQCYTN